VREGDTNDGFLYQVTANILDGNSLTPPMVEVNVEISNKSRELIFGNTCAE
jgi:hypothetical protein